MNIGRCSECMALPHGMVRMTGYLWINPRPIRLPNTKGSAAMSDNSDQTPGYGQPPEKGKFRAGQSGNPRGRPKGSKNKATILKEIAAEEHVVTVRNGKQKVATIDLTLHAASRAGAARRRESA